MKIIYDFELPREIEVEKQETREEGDQKITVTTKVKESRPLYFAIKRPNRAEKEEADLVRAKAFSYYVEQGVITQAGLRKKYGNTIGISENGGVYTTEEEQHYAMLRNKMRELLTDYQMLSSSDNEDEKKKSEEVFKEIFVIREEIVDFERSVESFYRDTAEAKARNKLIEYYITQLTQWKDAPEKEWKPYFGGKTHEERVADMTKKEDEDDEIYLAALDKLTFVISVLLTRPDVSKEEIKDIEETL